MALNDTKPRPFCDIYGAFSMERQQQYPPHATVTVLDRDVMAQLAVTQALHDMGQHRFVSMVNHLDKTGIAVPLYAGDGIVTKVTTSSHACGREVFPLVLPPFKERLVRCKDHVGDIAIESFPFVERRSLGEADVGIMRRQLAAYGRGFRDGDDRPDKFGRLPNGSLVVLDGGAVMQTKWDAATNELIARGKRDWQDVMLRTYPALYAPGADYSQSDTTSFALRPPPCATDLSAPKAKPAAPERKSWWSSLFHPA